MKRLTFLLGCLLVVSLLTATPAYSQGTVDKSVRKLGRGLVNVATGWVELPMQLSSGMSGTGGIEGFFLGLGKGLVWTVLRTGAGAIETATFLLPVPSDYGPLMQPPTVFE